MGGGDDSTYSLTLGSKIKFFGMSQNSQKSNFAPSRVPRRSLAFMQGASHTWPSTPPLNVRRSEAVPMAPRKRRERSRSPMTPGHWVQSREPGDLPDPVFWPDVVPKNHPTLQRQNCEYKEVVIEPGSAANPIDLVTPSPSSNLLCEEDFLDMDDWDIESVPDADFTLPPPHNSLCFHDNVHVWHIHSRK